MLGLDPGISCLRFSGRRFAAPENDGVVPLKNKLR
jgi:hypothetical protein